MLGLIVLLQALTVAVSGPPSSPEYLPLRVAEAEGYYAREGLAVTLRTTRAEVGAAEALAQGQVDLAATSLEALLRFGARATVAVPRLVFGLTAAPPVALVAPAQNGAGLSIEKLAGQTVGLTAPGVPEHTWLLGVLARAKVAPGQVRLVSLGTRGLEAALDGAEIHAGLIHEPAVSRLLADRSVILLADLRSPAAVTSALGAPTVSAAVFARADRRLDDRDLAAFARALLAAEERIQSTREVYLPQGRVTPDQLRRSIALIRAHVPLPARLKLPKPEDMLHQEPLRKALGSPPR